MLKFWCKNEAEMPIDKQIDAVLTEMSEVGVDAEEYPKLMSHLERLYKIKSGERGDRVSKDTVALVMGNLLGILLIVAYEQKHVMTSKGFTQIIRPKN